MRKVGIIGGGNVGASAAWQIASRDLADVALYDILPGVPAGEALDMTQAGAPFPLRPPVAGARKPPGVPRPPGGGGCPPLPRETRHGPPGHLHKENGDTADAGARR